MRRPTREQIILWVVFALQLIAGLWLVSCFHNQAFLHEFGVALFIAAILGLTVDTYLKTRIARDVFEVAVGHVLPPELREEMKWITTFKFLAHHSVHRIEIRVLEDDLVSVTTEIEREIENISSNSQELSAIVDVDEWGRSGHVSSVLACEVTYHGRQFQAALPAQNLGHYISANAPPVNIAPRERARVFYKFVEYKHANDLITYGLKHPTKDPEMDISIDAKLEYEPSFGHHGDVLAVHAGARRVLRGTFLPNHILSVRWWPKNSMIQKSEVG